MDCTGEVAAEQLADRHHDFAQYVEDGLNCSDNVIERALEQRCQQIAELVPDLLEEIHHCGEHGLHLFERRFEDFDESFDGFLQPVPDRRHVVAELFVVFPQVDECRNQYTHNGHNSQYWSRETAECGT